MGIIKRLLMCFLLCIVLLTSGFQVQGASGPAGYTGTPDGKTCITLKKSASVCYTGKWYTAYSVADEWKLRKLTAVQRRFGKAVMKAIREGTEDVVSIGEWAISYDEEEAVSGAISDMWYLFSGYPVFYRADSTYYEGTRKEEFLVDVRESRRMLEESEKLIRMCKTYVKVHVSAKAAQKKKADAIIEGLCRYMDYSTNISSVRSAIRRGKGVCADYSQIFRALCLSYGIQCRLISGLAETRAGVWEEHAWNQVRINGRWYYVDTTWLDAYLSAGENMKSAPYYLSKRLWRDHRIK